MKTKLVKESINEDNLMGLGMSGEQSEKEKWGGGSKQLPETDGYEQWIKIVIRELAGILEADEETKNEILSSNIKGDPFEEYDHALEQMYIAGDNQNDVTRFVLDVMLDEIRGGDIRESLKENHGGPADAMEFGGPKWLKDGSGPEKEEYIDNDIATEEILEIIQKCRNVMSLTAYNIFMESLQDIINNNL